MISARQGIICRQYSSILIGSIRDNNGQYAIEIGFRRNFCKSPSFLPPYFITSRVLFRNWLLRPGCHGCSAMLWVLNLIILTYVTWKLHKVGMFVQPTSLQGCVYINIISTQVSYLGNRLKLHSYVKELVCVTLTTVYNLYLCHTNAITMVFAIYPSTRY